MVVTFVIRQLSYKLIICVFYHFSASPKRRGHRSRSRSPHRRHSRSRSRSRSPHRRRHRSKSKSRSRSPDKSSKKSKKSDKSDKKREKESENSGMSKEELEIKEANELRAKLGLKPLKPWKTSRKRYCFLYSSVELLSSSYWNVLTNLAELFTVNPRWFLTRIEEFYTRKCDVLWQRKSMTDSYYLGLLRLGLVITSCETVCCISNKRESLNSWQMFP